MKFITTLCLVLFFATAVSAQTPAQQEVAIDLQAIEAEFSELFIGSLMDNSDMMNSTTGHDNYHFLEALRAMVQSEKYQNESLAFERLIRKHFVTNLTQVFEDLPTQVQNEFRLKTASFLEAYEALPGFWLGQTREQHTQQLAEYRELVKTLMNSESYAELLKLKSSSEALANQARDVMNTYRYSLKDHSTPFSPGFIQYDLLKIVSQHAFAEAFIFIVDGYDLNAAQVTQLVTDFGHGRGGFERGAKRLGVLLNFTDSRIPGADINPHFIARGAIVDLISYIRASHPSLSKIPEFRPAERGGYARLRTASGVESGVEARLKEITVRFHR